MKKLLFNIIILLTITVRASVSNITFVAFDIETTGFSPKTERIIETGAVKYRNGEINDSTHWLINPWRPIYNSGIHGLTNQQLAGYPGFSDTFKAFTNYVGNAILVAHNASLDVRFMAAEIERNDLPPIENPAINSLTLFRRWYPDADPHKLAPLAKQLNLPVSAEHRAEDDSATLLKILDCGLQSRPKLTLEQITSTANGTYHFDGTRKQ